MTDSYVKVFRSMLDSSVWQESAHTKLVWVTLMAMADRDGYVGASIPGLAARAGVPIDDCRVALAKFMAPDPDSRSKEFEGRRVEEADRGWVLLNHEKFLNMPGASERREQVRIAQQRQRAKRHQKSSTMMTPDDESSSVSVSVSVSADKKLLETRAREAVPANSQMGERSTDIAAVARSEFIRRYSSAKASVPSENALAKSMPAVVSWLRASAPLQGVSEQTLCGRLMEAFFASDKARESGYKPGFLAHDPAEWLEPPRQPAGKPVDVVKLRLLEELRAERKGKRHELAKCQDENDRYSLEVAIADLDSRIPRLEAAL